MAKIELLLGDCLEKLKELKDNSVDSVVTDPPYGLEFMAKEWDTFKTGRISKYKEGGSLDIDAIQSRSGKGGAGPSYTKRAAKRCRKCGKQEWSGSPCKCETPDFEIDNSTQYTFQEFSEAWAKECYRVLKPGGHLLAFAGSRMYHRLAVGVEDAGFEIRDQIMWIYGSGFPKSHNIGNKLGEEYKGIGTALKPAHEPIVMARKPFKGNVAQNVLEWGTGGINVDGCRIGNESRTVPVHSDDIKEDNTLFGLHPTIQHERVETTLGRFPANIIFDEESGNEEWKRYFYCPKASKSDRNEGSDNKHPTVKPTALMTYLIRLVTPKGGLVLDPFMGSGSTGKAAVREGMDFIGIEREEEYMEIAKSRIEYEQKKNKHNEFFAL